jgi:hypothetical protein
MIVGLNLFGQEPESKSNNWISLSYVKCLEKELPCECQKKEEHSLINLDTIGGYITLYNGLIYDPPAYKFKRKSTNTFEVYNSEYVTESYKNIDFIVGILQITSDNLSFIDNRTTNKTTFIRYGKYGDEYKAYTNEHVRLLNKALIKRNYPTLEKILHTDSLGCNCNPELNVINLVGSGKKAWILEQSNGTLFIYKWINIPDTRTLDLQIEKKLVDKYKW